MWKGERKGMTSTKRTLGLNRTCSRYSKDNVCSTYWASGHPNLSLFTDVIMNLEICSSPSAFSFRTFSCFCSDLRGYSSWRSCLTRDSLNLSGCNCIHSIHDFKAEMIHKLIDWDSWRAGMKKKPLLLGECGAGGGESLIGTEIFGDVEQRIRRRGRETSAFLFAYSSLRAWCRLAPSRSAASDVCVPSGLRCSVHLSKILKVSVNFIPWVRHADASHVFRPRSLLKDLIPPPKVGMGSEMNALSFSSIRQKSLFRISEPVFLYRTSKDPAWIIILVLLGCVESLTCNSFVSFLTDGSAVVRFSVFAILTCLVLEHPTTVVSGLSSVGLAMSPLLLDPAVVWGLFLGYWLALCWCCD